MIGNIIAIVVELLAVIPLFVYLKKAYTAVKILLESNKCQTRSMITGIYYQHCDDKEPTLRDYERQNLDKLTASYFLLGGNSYIKDIYSEMREWHVER